MKSAQIFQAIEETQFLKQLSSQDKILFIGEQAPLEYIESFFSIHKHQDNNYYYKILDRQLFELEFSPTKIAEYQAVIVVSIEDEDFLLSLVNERANLPEGVIPLKLFADVFVNLICRQPLLKHRSQQLDKAQVSYGILTTPRSGSTYLCNLLDSTNIAGHPSEHLRFATQELAHHCNFNYLDLLHEVIKYRTTNNGVFGTKFISHFLFELQQTKPDFKQIFSSIDKFILLIRKDKLAQAVSLVVAQKTEIWHLHHHPKNINTNYQSKLENIEINHELLDDVEQKYDFINKQEARLKKVLADNHIEALTVVYEDILANPELQIDRILNFLAIAKPPYYKTQIDSQVKKMPSSFSQKIIRQYQQRKSIVC